MATKPRKGRSSVRRGPQKPERSRVDAAVVEYLRSLLDEELSSNVRAEVEAQLRSHDALQPH